MKIKLLSLIVVLTICFGVKAQWSEVGGTNSSTFIQPFSSVAADSKENVYFTSANKDNNGKYFIGKWDGNKWGRLGDTSTIRPPAIVLVDSRDMIYSTNMFLDSLNLYYVITWDGKKWGKIGTYRDPNIFNSPIYNLTLGRNGRMYFHFAQYNQYPHANFVWLTVFNGINWNSYNVINNINPFTITGVTDDTLGNVYACGTFDWGYNATGLGIWDSGVNNFLQRVPGINDYTTSIASDKYGNIYTVGYITDKTGKHYCAKWDGTNWSSVIGKDTMPFNNTISNICIDKIGNIYATGRFTNSAGNHYIAKWDGTNWSELGGANTYPINTVVSGLTVSNNGTVYVFSDSIKNANGKYYIAKFPGPSPSLTIDKKDTTTCSFTVDVPIRAKDFYNIYGLKGSIGWDTSFLNFGGIKFAGKELVMDSSKIDFTNVANGKMAYNWSDTISHSVENSTPVFTLTFYLKKNFSGGTGIWFDSIPTKLEIDTAIGIAAKKATFNNGWVLLTDTPTVVQVGTILQCFAGCVPIHYQWYENGNPISGDTLNYITPGSDGVYTCLVTYRNGLIIYSNATNVVLPVTIITFKASPTPPKQGLTVQVMLNWITASEINTSHFNIQRSNNGKDFVTIGSVNAKGAGTYSFIDNNLPVAKSTLFYRLQIVDKDGALSYSDVRELSVINYQLSIAPNPAKSFVTVTGNNIKQVSLLDFTGRTVIKKEVSNTNSINLSVNNLSKGIYLVKAIMIDGSIKTEKLVVE